MEQSQEKFFGQFSETSTEDWIKKIETDLKGVPFEKRMVWRTNEGFNVMPFYRLEDIKDLKSKESLPGEFPYIRGTKITNSWFIRQDLRVDTAKDANEKMKTLLTKGVTAFGLSISKKDCNKAFILELIDGIDIDTIEINYKTCRTKVVCLAEAVVEAYKEKKANLATCPGSIFFDVFKKQLEKGVVTDEWIQIAKELLCATYDLKKFTVLDIMGLSFANAGSFVYQELAYTLSGAADVLDILLEKGAGNVEEIATKIRFNMGIGPNYFMEIAKFRVLRWLWAEIVGAHGEEWKGEPAKAIVHAENSMWNKTVYDAHVNLLRTQTESMSAVLGGVHSLVVKPFDVTYKESDKFSERIARNQQLLLKEESHFEEVVDPGAGSYYIEHLTNALAEEGWRVFLELDEIGGFVKNINSGEIQKVINETNENRHKLIAKRRESLLGTNIFPNFSEVAGQKIAKKEGSSCACSKVATVEPLDFRRGASDFEELRLATETAEKRPLVFMLTIGNLAMRLARSQFSSNFFACAGYQVQDNLGFKTVQDGVDAAIKAGADIITLCSSDDEYAAYGPEAFEYINNRVPLVIAGAPKCMDDLKAKGIEHFIHVKVNVLETLQHFHELMGIKNFK